jgi:Dolichyl-phosphate-mannose-protein mannosyltransferase
MSTFRNVDYFTLYGPCAIFLGTCDPVVIIVILKTPRAAGFLSNLNRRDHLFLPAVLTIGVLLFGLQWAGGAWSAEFDAYPDEAAHFVTGRMLWEYLSDPPSGSPVVWAEQYYLHYPKIGIGHWPPGYYLAEALWSLPFGSSRISAMWLQWFLGLVALTALYTLVRHRFPIAVTAAIVFLAMATPVFQQGLEQTMAELACLLCCVLLLNASVRLLTTPGLAPTVAVTVVIGAALLVKGTAVCFLPVPALAWFVSGKRLGLRSPWWWAISIFAVAGVIAFWYLAGREVMYWAGITFNMPWPILSIGRLAGWGFVLLAILGLRREPLAIAAGCMIFSATLVSFFFRAMNEPRHWIIVLPPILILAGFGVTRFKWRIGTLLATPALLLFPWNWYHQGHTGYRELVQQLHRPTRMLISSVNGAQGEGGWIAEVSVAERYPASFVVRASKVLSESGWNGEHYKLLAADKGAIERILDELAIEVVVLDGSATMGRPHHVLLAAAMEDNLAWTICGQSKNMAAWCRIQPPRFPRKPVIMDAGNRHLVEKR